MHRPEPVWPGKQGTTAGEPQLVAGQSRVPRESVGTPTWLGGRGRAGKGGALGLVESDCQTEAEAVR